MSDDISIQFICRKNTDGKRKWASGHKTAYISRSQQAWEVKHKWRPGVHKENIKSSVIAITVNLTVLYINIAKSL